MNYLAGIFLIVSVLAAPAQDSPALTVPPAFEPMLRQIIKSKTPAQWLDTIQKASPTAWQIIQKRAKEPNPKGFALADFQALPEKDQKALLAALTPLVTQAFQNMTPQEQLNLLGSAQKFQPDQVISPIFNQALGLTK